MNLILHITPREQWKLAQKLQDYRGDTLESEGFIHCSTPQQVIQVANTWFPARKGLLLLCINADKVRAEIRYEGLPGEQQFPHIYGPLNLDAVFQVLDFEPDEDGLFKMPPEMFNFNR